MWALFSAVKIKVLPPTHQPNRKTYRPMQIFEKCQISADISALTIYRSTTSGNHGLIFCLVLCRRLSAAVWLTRRRIALTSTSWAATRTFFLTWDDPIRRGTCRPCLQAPPLQESSPTDWLIDLDWRFWWKVPSLHHLGVDRKGEELYVSCRTRPQRPEWLPLILGQEWLMSFPVDPDVSQS